MAVAFPYHEVPDGSVALPHHYVWPLVLLLLVFAVVWDDYNYREPFLGAVGAVVGLLGFLLVWPVYPVVGATVALLGALAATIEVLYPVQTNRKGIEIDWLLHYPLWTWVGALLLIIIAWDDVLQHAFGIPTPLDWLWKAHLRALLPST